MADPGIQEGLGGSVSNLKDAYARWHSRLSGSPHVYPSEWIVRTFLGEYPDLLADRLPIRPGSRALDIGFGDGRNWPLLNNCGLSIAGVEIDERIVSLGYERARFMSLECNLKVGFAHSLPFPDSTFDVAVAANSFYYLVDDVPFENHLIELSRVCRPGGFFVGTLPQAALHFFSQNAEPLGNGSYRILNDSHGLRNGSEMRLFTDEHDVRQTFDSVLDNLSVAEYKADLYGYNLAMYVVCGNIRIPD